MQSWRWAACAKATPPQALRLPSMPCAPWPHRLRAGRRMGRSWMTTCLPRSSCTSAASCLKRCCTSVSTAATGAAAASRWPRAASKAPAPLLRWRRRQQRTGALRPQPRRWRQHSQGHNGQPQPPRCLLRMPPLSTSHHHLAATRQALPRPWPPCQLVVAAPPQPTASPPLAPPPQPSTLMRTTTCQTVPCRHLRGPSRHWPAPRTQRRCLHTTIPAAPWRASSSRAAAEASSCRCHLGGSRRTSSHQGSRGSCRSAATGSSSPVLVPPWQLCTQPPPPPTRPLTMTAPHDAPRGPGRRPSGHSSSSTTCTPCSSALQRATSPAACTALRPPTTPRLPPPPPSTWVST